MACNSLTFMANRFTAARCVCSSREGLHALLWNSQHCCRQVWPDALVVLQMLSERCDLLKSIFRFYALHSQLQKDKRTFGIDTTQWQVCRHALWCHLVQSESTH